MTDQEAVEYLRKTCIECGEIIAERLQAKGFRATGFMECGTGEFVWKVGCIGVPAGGGRLVTAVLVDMSAPVPVVTLKDYLDQNPMDAGVLLHFRTALAEFQDRWGI